jgi:flavin-dependent dehydrogenase
MHGIVLRNLGHNVKILESNALSEQKNLGAGIAAMDEVHTFMQNFSKATYTVTSQNVQFLDEEFKVRRKLDVSLKMTIRNCLHYLMRANFDGLRSEICTES